MPARRSVDRVLSRRWTVMFSDVHGTTVELAYVTASDPDDALARARATLAAWWGAGPEECGFRVVRVLARHEG